MNSYIPSDLDDSEIFNEKLKNLRSDLTRSKGKLSSAQIGMYKSSIDKLETRVREYSLTYGGTSSRDTMQTIDAMKKTKAGLHKAFEKLETQIMFDHKRDHATGSMKTLEEREEEQRRNTINEFGKKRILDYNDDMFHWAEVLYNVVNMDDADLKVCVDRLNKAYSPSTVSVVFPVCTFEEIRNAIDGVPTYYVREIDAINEKYQEEKKIMLAKKLKAKEKEREKKMKKKEKNVGFEITFEI